MTAPLTPHDQPTPGPQPSGATAYPLPGPDTGKDRPVSTAEVVEAVLVALAVAVLGVVMGLLWLWLAPRVAAISDGRLIYVKNSESEDAIGADGLFILLGLGLGALSAVAVFLFRRNGGIPLVLGLAVGGVLASVIAWRLGVFLGPETDIRKHARAVGPGVAFDKPLELGAKGALLAWSVAAMAVHLALTGLFGPRDPEPEPHATQPDAPRAH
ncbi:ABC transporter permease [Streptomyces sp. NPDC018031]|uniref:ABC transporter permease n=1 Tax=Streptomyces sp. NPDC018031 TaxID=3365033 RepID=UPI0037B4BD85